MFKICNERHLGWILYFFFFVTSIYCQIKINMIIKYHHVPKVKVSFSNNGNYLPTFLDESIYRHFLHMVPLYLEKRDKYYWSLHKKKCNVLWNVIDKIFFTTLSDRNVDTVLVRFSLCAWFYWWVVDCVWLVRSRLLRFKLANACCTNRFVYSLCEKQHVLFIEFTLYFV